MDFSLEEINPHLEAGVLSIPRKDLDGFQRQYPKVQAVWGIEPPVARIGY